MRNPTNSGAMVHPKSIRIAENTGGWVLPSETITQEVFNNLPELLRNACSQFIEPIEKEVFLVGALGVLSGCMPNYIGHYDGKWVTPHLYTYILAPFGGGKGTMTYARKLGEGIHISKVSKSEFALMMFKQAPKSSKSDKTDKTDSASVVRPPNEMLFIPANSSKTAMIEALSDNKGSGIIFETEGDTLADALKQDYASYSDVLRKAFHHEPIAYLRRQDKEYKELNSPGLAVVLSSTYGQLLSLIPSSENGLFSRFIFYCIKPKKDFKNVFAPNMERYEAYFKGISRKIEQDYFYLEKLDDPIKFRLTSSQQERFMHHFTKAKEESIDQLNGSINRLGIICFRLAMIFTMLRSHEDLLGPGQDMICFDQDFENAIALIGILKINAERVYDYINRPPAKQMPEDMQKLYDALPDQFTTAEGLKVAADMGIEERRAERYFSTKFTKVSHGNYAKRK